MRHTTSFLAGAAMLAVLAVPAAGQGPSPSMHRRLQQSLDAPTFRAVNVVLDSARARGVPVEPLINHALHATLHRTPGPRIRDAVATLSARLVAAKSALGPVASDAEIAAGANALAVGVPRETLAQIRTLSGGRPVTVPLGVLTELVARKVAVAAASQQVLALMRNGATPAQLVSLNEDVLHDVDAGIDPGAAFDLRTRGVLGTLEQNARVELTVTQPAAPPTTGAGTPGGKVTRKP